MTGGMLPVWTRCAWNLAGVPNQMQEVARRKLRMLNAAQCLDDLRIPPANRLEPLARERAGQHSIRINDQWRICFVWNSGSAE